MYKDKGDNYGTLFYKLRNGSLPFEYDTNKSIKEINESIKVINESLKDNNIDLYSALASSITSAISSYYVGFSIFRFVLSIIVIFLVFEIVLSGTCLIRDIIRDKREKKSPYEEIDRIEDEELQDLFYRKILVQTTYVYSVVKRIQELGFNKEETVVDLDTNQRENDKETGNNKIDFASKRDLVEIYSMQGVYGIRKISVEFGVLFNTKNNDSRNYYIEAIGIDNIEKTINMLSMCLNIIKDYYPKCVVQGDEDRIQQLNELLKTIKEKQKKDKDNKGGNKDNFAQNDERMKKENYAENSINDISSLEKKASNDKETSYKHIRTHKIPNNKRIYRFRKKKMKINFFNK